MEKKTPYQIINALHKVHTNRVLNDYCLFIWLIRKKEIKYIGRERENRNSLTLIPVYNLKNSELRAFPHASCCDVRLFPRSTCWMKIAQWSDESRLRTFHTLTVFIIFWLKSGLIMSVELNHYESGHELIQFQVLHFE